MDGNAIALAAIALAATSMGAVIWMAKYFATRLADDLVAHTKAAYKQVEASNKQTKASDEVLTFMKNLNGRLANAAIATAKSNKEILDTLQGSAALAKEAQADGGLLVKTKSDNPLDVKPVEDES